MKKYMNNYIAEFILYIFVSFLILDGLLEVSEKLMSPFLEYSLSFANALIVISLVILTILVIWYNNVMNYKFEQIKKLKAMDYYMNTLKIFSLVILLAFVYLVNATIFFDFDWRQLVEYQFYTYVGLLFPVSIFAQVMTLVGAYINRQKSSINCHLVALVVNIAIIFSAGFAYYLNYYMIGEFILILTFVNYFLWIYLATKTEFKLSLILLILPVVFLMITIPLFTDSEPNQMDQTHEFYQSEPVTLRVSFNNDFLGNVDVYESNELDVYSFTRNGYSYRYQTYKSGGHTLNITKANTIVDYELNYTPEDGYVYGFGIIDKDDQYVFCNESVIIEKAFDSNKCISNEILDVVIYITNIQDNIK